MAEGLINLKIYRKILDTVPACVSHRWNQRILGCSVDPTVLQRYWLTAANAFCFMDTWALSIPGTVIHLWNIKKKIHQQLHRNQWAPWNLFAWHQLELLFFIGASLGALQAGQHTAAGSSWIWCCDVVKWKSVMEWCGNWRGPWQVTVPKRNIRNVLNLHPTSCFLKSRPRVVITAHSPPPPHLCAKKWRPFTNRSPDLINESVVWVRLLNSSFNWAILNQTTVGSLRRLNSRK